MIWLHSHSGMLHSEKTQNPTDPHRAQQHRLYSLGLEAQATISLSFYSHFTPVQTRAIFWILIVQVFLCYFISLCTEAQDFWEYPQTHHLYPEKKRNFNTNNDYFSAHIFLYLHVLLNVYSLFLDQTLGLAFMLNFKWEIPRADFSAMYLPLEDLGTVLT